MVAFGAICEFLVPFLIVSRDPERVLELLLPSFRMLAGRWRRSPRAAAPARITQRNERTAPVSVNRDEVNDDGEIINGTSTSETGASTARTSASS